MSAFFFVDLEAVNIRQHEVGILDVVSFQTSLLLVILVKAQMETGASVVKG